jgi:hypothetical protein
MIAVTCPDCGKALLWHLAHEHRCDKQPQNIRPKRKPSVKPVPQTPSSSSPSPSSRRIDTPPPVDTPSKPVDTPTVSTRLQRWRAANRERYNAGMRDYRARRKALE